MTHLSLEAKESIVTKALSQPDRPLEEIAKESGVGYSTLQSWLRLKRSGLPLSNRRRGRPSKSQGQTPPLKHIMATAGLDEKAIGSYCREQGIHSFQINQWKDELMTKDSTKKQSDSYRKELKLLRDEIKNLKKDLRRKDKALAETSALLVLKKKAHLIWGGLEDD